MAQQFVHTAAGGERTGCVLVGPGRLHHSSVHKGMLSSVTQLNTRGGRWAGRTWLLVWCRSCQAWWIVSPPRGQALAAHLPDP